MKKLSKPFVVRQTINGVYVLLLLLLAFWGCRTSDCPEDFHALEPQAMKQHITNYHQLCFGQEKTADAADRFRIYVDFSGSMQYAFADEATEQLYTLFINSLKISSVDFFEVNKDEIRKIEGLDKSDLYKQIKDTRKFTGVNAPLNKTLQEIVNQVEEAVFITDGELWKDGERDDPWAREEFARWLKAGHRIDFFITDYMEKGKEKHLFFMFFVPKHQVRNKESITAQFLYYLENSLEVKALTYDYFSFSATDFQLVQDYETATSGGANEYLELDAESYVNAADTYKFEFHEYYLSWAEMVKYIREAVDDNTGEAIEGGTPLISKLFLETDALEFYRINALDIAVYDIKSDFYDFVMCEVCRKGAKPIYLKENGKKVLDENNEPIVEDPGEPGCYNEETGALLADTVFEPNTDMTALTEVFSFDQKAFMNNFEQEGKGEIIIKLHPNFNGSQVGDECNNLHRIDVLLKSVESVTDNPKLEKFIWEGSQLEKNRSMYNSILGALNDANPQGQVIYSFYVLTPPNDYYP